MKSKGYGEPLKFETIQAAIENNAEAINQILCYFQPFILNVRENTWMNLEEPIM